MFTFIEHLMIFFPTRHLHATPAYVRLPFEDITITTDDNEKLHGWWVPHEAERAVVVLFHGNAGNISDRVLLLQLLHSLEVTTMLFDYRGYGESTGEPSEHGLYADARAAIHWLTSERKVAANRIILFGRSLGATAAVDVATTFSPAGVILEGAFSSARDMARTLPLGVLLAPMVRIKLDNMSKIGDVKAPLLCIHGDRDTVVPTNLGERLYNNASEPKQWIAIPGADHNDTQQIGGELYARALRDFIWNVAPPKPEANQ